LTSSPPSVRVGAQTPRVANYPPYAISAAPEVIALAESAKLFLDPWQKYLLTHGLGQRLDEAWTARKVSVWVPRQNGKGGVIEALELAWLFLFGEDLVVHSAHQHRTSQKAYERLERIIRRTPHLHRKVSNYRQANGEQQIELRDGRMLQYTTRSRTAVRGFSAPKIVLDEAQELNSEQIAAILPTVSAMPNWQVWFFGTPPADPTAWVYSLKEDGEANTARLAHFDWGIDLNLDDPADLAKTHDRDIWYATNPALGIRIDEETVEDEDKPSGLGAEFPQERLGHWKPRAAAGAGVIPADLWRRLADPGVERPEDVAFALHVNLLRTHAAIAYAGRRPDGLTQVGIVDYRPGVSWVLDRIVTLKSRWNPVAIGIDTRSENLLLDLDKAGIKPPVDDDHPVRGDLALPGPAEVAAGFGLFVDDARREQIRHLDEVPLNVALGGANTRPLSGGLAWDHKSSVEISPLVAVTLAVWAYETRAHLVVHEYDPLNNIW